MWPCLWGMAYRIDSLEVFIKYSFLFILGSFVMRGAGCCINDIIDKDLDILIKRTKDRPLASGKIDLLDAIFFTIFQLLIGLIILFQFNLKIIFFGIFIMPLVITYPLFKRVTFFPQIVLGIVFNWGVILGLLVENEDLSFGGIMLYLAGVIFTITYDTIYGMQDIKDDKKVGVKSLAILIEKRFMFYIGCFYLLTFIFFFISLKLVSTNNISLLSYSLILISVFLFQIIFLWKKKEYKKNFDMNIISGGLIFLVFLLQNYF
tara:strand:- start:62 stop:847 length:786 start_codon:yes stop_codon:yes gene_type:complete